MFCQTVMGSDVRRETASYACDVTMTAFETGGTFTHVEMLWLLGFTLWGLETPNTQL